MHLDTLVYNSFQIIWEVPNIETFRLIQAICAASMKKRGYAMHALLKPKMFCFLSMINPVMLRL